jgi:hypothetical protein
MSATLKAMYLGIVDALRLLFGVEEPKPRLGTGGAIG